LSPVSPFVLVSLFRCRFRSHSHSLFLCVQKGYWIIESSAGGAGGDVSVYQSYLLASDVADEELSEPLAEHHHQQVTSNNNNNNKVQLTICCVVFPNRVFFVLLVSNGGT
jgi:hypothetical protein